MSVLLRRLFVVAIVALSLALAAAPAGASNHAEDSEPDPETGGTVLVVGFIAVGIGAAIVAARLAKRSQDRLDED